MLKLGQKTINKLMLGDKSISKAYLGEKLVYQTGKPLFLDYVYFDGNCYIDTDIAFQTCTIETAVKFEAGHSRRMLNGWIGLYRLYWGMTTTGTFELGGAELSNTNLTDYTEFKIVYDVTAETVVPTVDGQTSVYQITPNYTEKYTIGCSTPSSSNKVIGNVYYHKFTDVNGTLIQDLRPCIDPNGTVCFYDTVTKKYFYNKGTGTLTAGNVIKFVEYIESSGTQYIDTGINASKITRFVVKGTCSPKGTSNSQLIGTIHWDSKTFFGTRYITATKQIYWYCADEQNNYLGNPLNVSIIDATIESTTSQFGTLTDLVEGTVTDFVAFVPSGNEWAFGYGNLFLFGGDISRISPRATCYSLQLYTEDGLVRDLRPCLDENNTPCMYDMVTNKFFYNAGTGEFIAGGVL